MLVCQFNSDLLKKNHKIKTCLAFFLSKHEKIFQIYVKKLNVLYLIISDRFQYFLSLAILQFKYG